MKYNHLTRRDFLKLLELAPLLITSGELFNETIATPTHQVTGELPNFLILVFDAFSAENISLYGYPRNTTPNIDRFARQSTVFHRHYAGGNFTSPGTATMFTGTYPWTHRVFQLLGLVDETLVPTNLFGEFAKLYHTFAYTHNPLAYVLLHQFRETINQLTAISELCVASDNPIDRFFPNDYPFALEAENLLFRNETYPSASLFLTFPNILKRYYLRQSSKLAYQDKYPREISRFSLEAPPAFMYFKLEDAIDWLLNQLIKAPQPFLGYIHLFPPHHPYITRREFVDRFKDGWEPVEKPTNCFSEGFSQQHLNEERRLYDECIAYVDAEFGRLFDAMQTTAILDNTYLILTSDHGEMFERGIATHNTPTLYEPIVRIPLLVSSPNQKQRRDVYSPTSNVDLLPTVCNAAGLTIPPQCEGKLLPIFENERTNPDRSIYIVEAKQNPKSTPLHKATFGLIKGDYKLIYYLGYDSCPDTFELYNISRDPNELTNIYKDSDPISLALKDELLTELAKNAHR